MKMNNADDIYTATSHASVYLHLPECCARMMHVSSVRKDLVLISNAIYVSMLCYKRRCA